MVLYQVTNASVVSGLAVNRTAGETVGTYVVTPSGGSTANYTISYVAGQFDDYKGGFDHLGRCQDQNLRPGRSVLDRNLSRTCCRRYRQHGCVWNECNSWGRGKRWKTIQLPRLEETSANYTLSYTTNTLIINKAPLTISAVDKTKVYGQNDLNLRCLIAGLPSVKRLL